MSSKIRVKKEKGGASKLTLDTPDSEDPNLIREFPTFTETQLAHERAYELVMNEYNTIITSGCYFSLFLEIASKLPKEVVEGWAEVCVNYVGFDAAKMRIKLRQTVTTKHLVFMIQIGLMRGTKVRKIMQTMRDKESVSRFKRLANLLKLKDASGGYPLTVTLSRFIACFPDIVLNIMKFSSLPMALPKESLFEVHVEFPTECRYQGTAGAIVTKLPKEDKDKIVAMYMVNTLLTSRIIGRDNPRWRDSSDYTRAHDSLKFVSKSYNSSVLNENERANICLKFKIVVSSGSDYTLCSAWKNAGAACLDWIIKEFGFDVTKNTA